MPNVDIGEIWIFAILLLTLYMLPTFIAHSRSVASRGAITVLNIFLCSRIWSMDTTSFEEWLKRRLDIADSIVTNFYHLALYDAEILLCCTVSSLAAAMWPGKGIDRVRYVEFLVGFSRVCPALTLISVPRLVAHRREAGDGTSVEQLKRAFYPESDALVVTHRQIDTAEDEVRRVVPELPISKIRRASYAHVIYEDLRSGLVHEFMPTSHLSDSPMTTQADVPSYYNLLDSSTQVSHRLLHLPYDYIQDVVQSSATAAFDKWKTADNWEQPRPAEWWVDKSS